MPSYRQLFRAAQEKVPTVSASLEVLRKPIQERGELFILYFNFDRYAKVEEIYGWEKLDEILETTTAAMRDFFRNGPFANSQVMVSFANDDDFILFHVPAPDMPVPTDEEITDLTVRLHQFISTRVEEQHGESVAALFDTYVGRAHIYYDPKIRLERQIYRGIREAAASSVSVEQRELARKSADLRETLRTGALYIDYHPIVVTDTQEIFGYEALARGKMRSMRRPEVMFEVAAQSDMIWELSRLCRNTAILGMKDRLEKGQLLFINVDPHDFTDPAFTEMDLDVPDPSRVVLRSRRERRSRIIRNSGVVSRIFVTAAIASPWTMPAAVTPASAPSPTSSPISSSSTSHSSTASTPTSSSRIWWRRWCASPTIRRRK